MSFDSLPLRSPRRDTSAQHIRTTHSPNDERGLIRQNIKVDWLENRVFIHLWNDLAGYAVPGKITPREEFSEVYGERAMPR